LAHQKLDVVSVCPHWSLDEFIEIRAKKDPSCKGKKGREKYIARLSRGEIPRYHLLPECNIEQWERKVRVIDFQNVYGLPYQFVTNFANKNGKRLRLLPPYREHLSQAFARFFMRVGLPIPLNL
jgi:hypothetical protein